MSKMIILIVIFIILGLIDVILGQQTFTKLQLKGLHQQQIDLNFEAKIKDIVAHVVYKAQVQTVETRYTYPIMVSEDNYEILNKKTDQEIIAHLQAILLDADITISQRECGKNMGLFSGRGRITMCKDLTVQW